MDIGGHWKGPQKIVLKRMKNMKKRRTSWMLEILTF